MSKIRVLIVDDAVVVRRILTDVLTSDPDIEVAGIAANGQIALQKIQQLAPDLVTMDVEMPTMNGVETVRAIRKTHPKLPVIMFSTLTARGAEATLDALAAGATDYVTKPANVGSVSVAMERIREQLIPKIKGQFGHKAAAGPAPIAAAAAHDTSKPAAASALRTPLVRGPVKIIAIGTSTGGPNALAEVIPKFPASLPVPVVIVQHMPPIFTKLLASRLSSQGKFPVKEAVHGDRLEPGRGYIAPGDFHMALEKRADGVHVVLHQEAPENSCRPAVDVLFRSVAEIYGGSTLGVILTGMGQDGLRGCTTVKDAGGRVLAQDEPTSVVWGMPGFVAKAGLADKVLPLGDVAEEIVRITTLSGSFPMRTSTTTAARTASAPAA
jgi:two-component system chemotaxis response regulator CheB